MKIFNSIASTGQRLLKEDSGAAIIEFAFILPLLVIIFYGTVEISNFVYAQQKLQSASDNIVNIINLQDDISNRAQLRSIATILPRIVRPLEVSSENDYSVIVTVIQRDAGEDFAYISAQPKFGGGPKTSNFSFNATATVNSQNQASLADLNFTFNEGDQVIIVEGYMRYKPLIDSAFVKQLLGLPDGFLSHRPPPTQPRIRRFQFTSGNV